MEKMMQNPRTIKIICIIMSVLLWLYVSYQENPSMTKTVRNVPVTVIGEQTLNDNGYSIFSISESSVDVKATAKRLSLARLNNKTLSATINVSSINSAGTYTIPASVTSSLSTGGSFLTKGNDIKVVVEPILIKTLDIEEVISSPADPSVKLKTYKLSDTSVTVSAPESIMKKIGSIRTETVIPGSTGGSQSAQLLVYSKSGKILEGVQCEPSKITVSYSLYSVKRVPIVLKTTSGKSFELPSSYDIEVYGSSGSSFDKLKRIETNPIDLSHYEVGSAVNLLLRIPDYAKSNNGSTSITITLDEEIYDKLN